MTVTVQTIEETAIPGVYETTVQVGAYIHHFEITVTATELLAAPGPLLTASGDSKFYEVLGHDRSYPTILQQVSRYHQGETLRFPLVVQEAIPA